MLNCQLIYHLLVNFKKINTDQFIKLIKINNKDR